MRTKDLTKREQQVAALIPLGITNAQIARRLRISEQTAKFHVCNVLDKLEVRNRTEAAAKIGALVIPKAPAPIAHVDLGWPWLP